VCVDGLKYWHKNVSADSPPGMWRSPYRRARSVDIEMTAYALLTYTRRRDFAGAVPIVKWIVSQRNSRGGFSSTQVVTDFLFFKEQCVVIGCKLKQNANEGCNSCASLAELVLCFIACFILLVIAPLLNV